MTELQELLRSGNHSLVVAKTEVNTYDGRGVSDLFRLLHDEPEALHGALLADKVVGKGAAALMVVAKAAEVYAEVISQPALDMLLKAGIVATYGQLVEHIINCDATDMCPLEKRCMACRTAEECIPEITAFIEEMKAKHASSSTRQLVNSSTKIKCRQQQ